MTNTTIKNAIRSALPWNANIDWCDDEPTVAMILCTSPINVRRGIRVSVSSVDEAIELRNAVLTHGTYHGYEVSGFVR